MEIPVKLGKYEVKRELGRGAMGVVYEGFDPAIQRRVALKTIKSDQLEGVEAAEMMHRFQREAQAAGRLTHGNIVGIYELGEDNGTVFIAMEFVEGKELKDYFDTEQRFPIPEVRRIMGEILDALDYSHRQGVVHRDIKPANIILLGNGTVKVADFGIARLESSTLTQAGSVLGTPSYMSPEQFMGQTVDGRSDIFSAGVVLYQFLTGERPFTGAFTTIMHKVLKENPPLPSELNVQVPMVFDTVVRKALAKRPEDRYQTAAEFRQAVLTTPAVIPAVGAADATLINPGTSDKTVVNPVFDSAIMGAGTLPHTPTPTLAGGAAGAPPQGPVTAPGAAPAAGRKGGAGKVIGYVIAGLVVVVIAGFSVMRYREEHGQSTVALGNAPAASSAAVAAPAVALSMPVAQSTMPVAAASAPPADGTAVITAMGVVDPDDSRYQHDPEALRQAVIEDAKRQLVAKAAGMYVEQASLDKNYAVVRDKLLNRSGEFIKTVYDQQAPTLGANGLMSATLRASVNLRAVQKSLNQMSNDERIDFIRKNGDPKISVNVASRSEIDGGESPPEGSPVAENLLKERIKSFGFRVVSAGADGGSNADFGIDSEVHFKTLSAKLPASGLTIQKVVMTSWTVKATDRKTGEDIYYNTKIPQKQSWNSQEQALEDVGHLIGDEFTKTFFLQYFQYPVQQTRLDLSSVPPANLNAVIAEIGSIGGVLNAAPGKAGNGANVVDATLPVGSSSLSDAVQGDVLQPINGKLGKRCLSVGNVSGDQVQVLFDASCNDPAVLMRLEQLPPAGLMSAPAVRRDDVVKNPAILKRMTV